MASGLTCGNRGQAEKLFAQLCSAQASLSQGSGLGRSYLVQPVVMDGNVVQPDGLFDVLQMRIRGRQCKLVFVHVRNVLQNVLLPPLGNNLLGHRPPQTTKG